jgi:DHA3 family tetracycline resistance protein-like MFS transporter
MSHVPRLYYLYRGVTAFAFTLTFLVSAIYYIQVVEVTAFHLLMIGFALELSCFLFEIPTGVVADLYSRRLSMVIGLFLIGIGFLLQGWFPELTVILLAQVLWGMGVTFLSGADQAWVTDESAMDRVEPIFLRGAQVGHLGTLAGIGVSVLLAQHSIQTPMLFSGVLFLLFAIVVIRWYPENHFVPNPLQERKTWQRMGGTFLDGWQVVKGNRILMTMLVIGLMTGMYSEGFDRLWQLHLLENVTLPTLPWGNDVVWFGLIQVVALVLTILAVEWVQRRFSEQAQLEKVWVLMGINGLLVGVMVSFAWSKELWMALGTYWMVQMLRRTHEPLFQAWLNETITHSHLRATILSTQGQLYTLGELVGGPLVALVVLYASVSWGLTASSLILTPTVLLYGWLWREGRRQRIQKTGSA